MKTRFISVTLLITLSMSLNAFAQQAVSGGAAGFDESLSAIEPGAEALSLSPAGDYPADISRYILASNLGARNARISPDGELLAFIWAVTGARQLWVTAQSGGQPTQLTFGNGVTNFRWSPDGQSLFYSADNNGDEREAYYKISKDGTKEEELLPSTSSGFRVFGDFLNEHTIAYASTERNGLDFDIYVANTKTQTSELVHQGKFGFFVESASPDGRYLALSETVGEDSDNLYLFDLNTKRLITVSQPERRANHTDAGIAWTPDSKGFYLASNLERNFTALMHYSLADGFSLIHEAQGDVEDVFLCGENANYLIWNENKGGYSNLNVRKLDTQKDLSVQSLPEGDYVLDCNQQSNKLAITINGWKTPGDIYVRDLLIGAVSHSFKSSLAGLAADRLVQPESITMTARDGVTLQGLLYTPAKTKDDNSKPPVLFRVHGGPTAQSKPTFSASTQYLVGKGIAVFLPNVRGSTGFGHRYTTLDDQEKRLDSIRDLVDMLAHLRKEGLVDADRAAVAGGSYGGYAVNAVLSSYPGRFIAGASLFGVADWVTALRIASPALKASDRIEYGDITEQKWLDFYTQQSPIRLADKIDVPVLFSHGVMDPRIDIAETEVMVRTLRNNGIEAPFIRIPDEGHGWRKLHNQLFYYRQEAEFLERVLKVKQ